MTQRSDQLFTNAENLLEQAMNLGPESDITVLELSTGGYYLITGTDHDVDAMQIEHGARSAWQVKNLPSSILVSGRSGDRSCLLKRERYRGGLGGSLRDAPAYLLV